MIDKINLGYPNIWIQNNDPQRIIDIITSSSDRTFFHLTYDNGLCQYVDGMWKQYLIDNPAHLNGDPEAPPYVPCFDPGLAVHTLSKIHSESPSKISFITVLDFEVENQLVQYSVLIPSNRNKYRDAFWSDDLSKMPFQTIFISPQECPDQFAPFMHIAEDQTPSAQELYTIVEHISTSSHERFVDSSNIKEIVSAGLGLQESTFIDLCLSSIHATGSLDPKYVYDAKMKDIKSKGILEIIKPTVTFDKIGGLDNIKDIIKRTAFLRQNKQRAQEYGITPIRRILMVGVPGTGKSAICQATASELSLDLARTGISQVMNSFIGQSEANMRAVFKQIKAMSPVCVWIDEFGRDLSGGSSSSHVDGGTTDRVHGEFLTGLQELPEESFLLCAANELHALKPEMLRADRFDKIFFVGLPSHEERKHIFQINLRDIKTDKDFDYDALADASAFMTGAEIVTLIRETKFYVVSEDFRPITTQDIVSYASQMRNTIWRKHPDMVKSMYEYALEQWDWASTSQMEDAKIILGRTTQKSKAKVVFN